MALSALSNYMGRTQGAVNALSKEEAHVLRGLGISNYPKSGKTQGADGPTLPPC